MSELADPKISIVHGQAMPEVEEVLSALLDSATSSVRISTGLSTGIFLHDRPRKALLDCLARLTSTPTNPHPMKVLLDATVTFGEAQRYAWWFDIPKVEVHRSPSPVQHMMVIDGKSFRLEDSHAPAAPSRSNKLILNADPNGQVARLVVSYFDELFDGAPPAWI